MPYQYYQPPSTWGNVLLASAGLMGSFSSIYQGYLGLQSAENAARLLEIQAEYAQIMGGIAEAQIRRQLGHIIGTQRAATAAAGIRPDVGTPLELQIETEILNDIDANLARISGGMSSLSYSSAAIQRIIEGMGGMSQAFGQAFGYNFNTLLQLADRRTLQPAGFPGTTTYRPPTMTTQEALGF
jgi:hypothetical protein